MGKCGGRELNYISDVDVIFVAEPSMALMRRTRCVLQHIGERDDACLLDDHGGRFDLGSRCGFTPGR